MQLATLIGQMFESGKVTVCANNVEAVEIRAANKRIDVNATNKDFVKEVIASVRSAGREEKGEGAGVGESVKESVGGIRSTGRTVRDTLDMLKDVAEELRDAGITVTISYKGDVVVTMGSEAKSRLSRLVTGTKAIEINSLPKLIEMGL